MFADLVCFWSCWRSLLEMLLLGLLVGVIFFSGEHVSLLVLCCHASDVVCFDGC
jgi:hypothetical protein